LSEKFLLYVGRIDPRKNLIRLIEAWSQLRRNHQISHQLVIAGKVYLLPETLQSVCRDSEFQNDIHLCGYVPKEDLPHLYRAADAFVYPSEYEGFGFPPLEAMACGVPVVASDIPIFQEILSDACLLVDPRNVTQLAQSIHRVITDPELRKELIARGLIQSKK